MNISSDDLELFLIEFKEALVLMNSGLDSLEGNSSGSVGDSVEKLYDSLSGLMGIVDFIECNTLTLLCNQMYSCILKLKKDSSLWDVQYLSLFQKGLSALNDMYGALEQGNEPLNDSSLIVGELKQLAETLSGQKTSFPKVNPDEEELLFDEMSQMISSFSDAIAVLATDQGNQEALFECYKSAHTLKGFGAMINFDPLNKLATVTEKLFLKAREEGLEIDDDILFLCKEVDSQFKLMKEDLLAKANNTYENEELIDDIKFFFASDDSVSMTTVNVTPDPIPISDNIKVRINDMEAKEGFFYDVIVVLDDEIDMKSVRCYQYLEQLKEMGEVIAVYPEEETIKNSGFICTGIKMILFSVDIDEVKVIDALKQVEEAKTMIVTKREV